MSGHVFRTAVYRLFDDAGQLLYVGVGHDPQERWNAHRLTKAWWGAVSRKEVTWHDTREAAFAEEREAIANEAPLHNTAGGITPTPQRRSPGVHMTVQATRIKISEILDRMEAGKGEPIHVTRHGKRVGVLVSADWYNSDPRFGGATKEGR